MDAGPGQKPHHAPRMTSSSVANAHKHTQEQQCMCDFVSKTQEMAETVSPPDILTVSILASGVPPSAFKSFNMRRIESSPSVHFQPLLLRFAFFVADAVTVAYKVNDQMV